MKTKILGAIAMLAALAVPALAQAATRGYSTANVNMRSGPSTAYPAVAVVPVGAPLTVYGCLSQTPWCDVSFAGGRGWVAGRYIVTTYRQNRVYVEPRYYRDLGVPIITFDVGRYWDRYYRDRDFYGERERWRRLPPRDWDRPPPRREWDHPPRPDWRDNPPPRSEWRDNRQDDWRDRRGPGPNDGRWQERYGDWNREDRQRPRDTPPPPRYDGRSRFEGVRPMPPQPSYEGERPAPPQPSYEGERPAPPPSEDGRPIIWPPRGEGGRPVPAP